METVTIFRMETPDGSGPFDAMPWEAYQEFTDLHDVGDAGRFPTPWLDWELQDDPNFQHVEGRGVFGCCDKATLKEWFPPHTLPMLDEFGVQFTVWQVPAEHVARSDRQAAFVRDEATLLERRPTAALYEPDAQLDLDLKEAA